MLGGGEQHHKLCVVIDVINFPRDFDKLNGVTDHCKRSMRDL